MAHYIMLFSMILRDIEMFKSQKVTYAYPYIPAYLEETEISNKDVQSILAWYADVAKAVSKCSSPVKVGPPRGVKQSPPNATTNRDDQEQPVKQTKGVSVVVKHS